MKLLEAIIDYEGAFNPLLFNWNEVVCGRFVSTKMKPFISEET